MWPLCLSWWEQWVWQSHVMSCLLHTDSARLLQLSLVGRIRIRPKSMTGSAWAGATLMLLRQFSPYRIPAPPLQLSSFRHNSAQTNGSTSRQYGYTSPIESAILIKADVFALCHTRTPSSGRSHSFSAQERQLSAGRALQLQSKLHIADNDLKDIE
jgi:hypothetical protein